MSLNMNGGRLLAEALADAIERDLSGVPPREELERQHRFSRKFVRGIKNIEAGAAAVTVSKHGGRAVLVWRIGGMAAALVCVVGLAALLGSGAGLPRAGSSSGDASDTAVAEDYEEAAWLSEESLDEANDTEGLSEDGGTSSELALKEADNNAEADEATSETETDGSSAASDWQEQLLTESAKADELAAWVLGDAYDGVIELESVPAAQTAAQLLRISRVYEVYYETDGGAWERVYCAARELETYAADDSWQDCYSLEELNMNSAGSYRLVRQVNNYRQVLTLTLE